VINALTKRERISSNIGCLAITGVNGKTDDVSACPQSLNYLWTFGIELTAASTVKID